MILPEDDIKFLFQMNSWENRAHSRCAQPWGAGQEMYQRYQLKAFLLHQTHSLWLLKKNFIQI